MSSRILLATLVVLWFVGVSRGLGADAERVRIADDFATNTLKDYEIKGDVTWRKGQVTLGKEAQLTRKLALGHTAAVRAVLRLPAEEGAEIVLRFQGEKVNAAVALRRRQGKTVLVNLEKSPEEVVLVVEPAGPVWVVRCELRSGMIQASVWPEGKSEPAAWQTIGYSGATAWEPRSVQVAAGKPVGDAVTALEVTGLAPVPPLSPELRQEAGRAEALNREVVALYRQGKSREAVDKAREVLAIRKKVLGPDNLETGKSLNDLGVLLEAQGDYAAARPYNEQALAIYKKVLGPEHPDTARSLNNLGALLQAQGECAAARSYYEQALAIHKKVLGPEHPDTAGSLNNLGVLLAANKDARGAWRALVASADSYARLTDRLLPAGTKRLLVAPDGELALLPFEAIRLEDGRYLVEQFQVSYLSSGRDLMPRPTLKDPPGPALVLADPDYDAVDDAPAPAPGPLVAQAGAQRSGDLEKRGIRFNRLPGVAVEADAVLRAWQAARPGDKIERLQGRDASEEKLAAASRPRLLYLITHGFFLPDLELLAADRDRLFRNFEVVPLGENRLPRLPGSGEDPRLRSGLALAGANRWQQRAERGQSDGLLTALEVQNLDLWGTELVVLSACETGVGEVSNIGEGVLGLRRAFQGAGAHTVLASLWKVPDADTERLMTKFFARWLKGTPKAQALREAQLELLAELRKDPDPKRRAAPPLLWAGFICHGQPD